MGQSKRRRDAKREQFFSRGVEAYQRLSGDDKQYYPCPICLECFDREALDARNLTLEHIPPESIGGKPLCLTCKSCNDRGGHSSDHAFAELKRFQSMNAALFGKQDQ